MAWTFTCWSCRKTQEMIDKIYRSHTCVHCGIAKHSCRNCKFYDRYASNECSEPMSDYVKHKEQANFCDYFVYAESENETSKADEARAKLEALFKK